MRFSISDAWYIVGEPPLCSELILICFCWLPKWYGAFCLRNYDPPCMFLKMEASLVRHWLSSFSVLFNVCSAAALLAVQYLQPWSPLIFLCPVTVTVSFSERVSFIYFRNTHTKESTKNNPMCLLCLCPLFYFILLYFILFYCRVFKWPRPTSPTFPGEMLVNHCMFPFS